MKFYYVFFLNKNIYDEIHEIINQRKSLLIK